MRTPDAHLPREAPSLVEDSRVIPFVAITFAITWTIAVMVIGFSDWFARTFGALGPNSGWFYLAVWAPNIAALLLSFAYAGPGGVVRLLRSLTLWRVPVVCWLVALLAYPALLFAVHALKGDPIDSAQWIGAAGGVFSLAVWTLGPLGEELGWRGYLLPRLIKKMGSLRAALLVGALWMVWHFPAFKVATLSQSHASYPVFFATGIALSVMMTWLYNRTKGSVLVAGVIPHLIANAFSTLTDYSWVQAAVMLSAAAMLIVLTRGRLGEAKCQA